MTSTSAATSFSGSRGAPNPVPLVRNVVERDERAPVLVPLAVSPRRAAQYLGVGHDAIHQLLNQGRLRSVKLGRRRLIPLSELERFLADELRIATYSQPGDLVVDPMCGICTTLVEAVHLGRDAIGVEYEDRWAGVARTNLALARSQGAAGNGEVVRGDARHLASVVDSSVRGLERASGRRTTDTRSTPPTSPMSASTYSSKRCIGSSPSPLGCFVRVG